MPNSSIKRILATIAVAGLSVTALASLAIGCAADQSTAGRISGGFATVYSSLPRQGPHAQQSRNIINAQKLALSQAGGEAGRFKINFAVSDDSTSQGQGDAPGWNADRVANNARSAVENSHTIAYIGDFDSAATAISLPITNGAGIAQLSPASTAAGLTRPAIGSDKGEPEKYYPSGQQTFARVVPADDVQASAGARWARRLGAKRVLLLGDKSGEGNALVTQFGAAAEKLGLTIVEERTMDPRRKDYKEFASRIAEQSPDTIYFGGSQESNALQLWRDLHAAMPDVRLMGPSGLLVPAFYARIGSAAGKTFLTSSVQNLRQLPEAGQSFVADYRKAFGKQPDSYAAYGYTAMAMLLDAIDRAGDRADQREEVVEAMIATKNFDSPIGRFSIDANGDTSLNRIAGYEIENRRPSFAANLRGARAAATPPR